MAHQLPEVPELSQWELFTTAQSCHPVFVGQEGVSIVFDWQSEPKKYGSMFVGTVPELDLAVYTICFLAR